MLFELEEALVRARDLLQIHGARSHESEWGRGVVVFVELAGGGFVEGALGVDRSENSAGGSRPEEG